MTLKEALNIIETYNYWEGGADSTGNICINPKYLEARKKYDEAKNLIEKQDEIELMLKQKECVLRYVASEDCFAVRCILDDKWYKLTDGLIKNNIREEIKPSPLIDKVKELKEKVGKQDKILSILKNNTKLVDYKENSSTQAFKIIIEDKFTIEEDGEYVTCRNSDFDDIKGWLDNEKV